MHRSVPILAALAAATVLPAQTVTEIAAPTVAMGTTDLDLLPTGAVTLGTLQATSPGLLNITFTPNTAAAGVYDTQALHNAICTVGGVMGIIAPGVSAPFDATDCQIDLNGPSTEIGFGIGDWVGPMVLDFYLSGSLVTTYTTSSQTGNRIYYQMSGGQFDRVDIRASTTGGNWVIEDVLDIQNAGGNYGYASPYGTGCGGGGAPGFYEQFLSGFDLANTGTTMVAAGSAYLLLTGAAPIVAPTGSPVVTGDDQTLAVAVPFGAMPYQAVGGFSSTPSLWVCSNGWIAFESTTSTTYTESVAELLSGPARICPMWDDLNPSAAGGVYAEVDPSDPNTFHVTWVGVPEYSSTGSNTFQVSFHSNGDIELKYGACSVADCIVGCHPGNGADDPGPIDISAATGTLLGDGQLPLDLAAASGSRPALGTTFAMQVGYIPGAAPTFGFQVFSFTQNMAGIPLDPVGLIGCNQYFGSSLGSGVDAMVSFAAPTPPTQVLSVPIPNWTGLVGVETFVQVAVNSASAPGGYVASNGLSVHVGN